MACYAHIRILDSMTLLCITSCSSSRIKCSAVAACCRSTPASSSTTPGPLARPSLTAVSCATVARVRHGHTAAPRVRRGDVRRTRRARRQVAADGRRRQWHVRGSERHQAQADSCIAGEQAVRQGAVCGQHINNMACSV